MKNVTQKLKLLPFMLMACILFSSCNDLLEENDGQLATGDLDFTKTEDMIKFDVPVTVIFGNV